MDLDDDPMAMALNENLADVKSEENNEHVMLDAVDDYVSADFGNLGDFEQHTFTVAPQGMPQGMQDAGLTGVESFGTLNSPRPASGSLDALGLAGLDFQPLGHAQSAPCDSPM